MVTVTKIWPRGRVHVLKGNDFMSFSSSPSAGYTERVSTVCFVASTLGDRRTIGCKGTVLNIYIEQTADPDTTYQPELLLHRETIIFLV